MNEENNNSSEKRRMDWHSGFEGGLRYSFRNYASDIEIERERLLSKQPLRIDFLVVKNNTQIVIDNDIGRSFRKYNIIEYKNPDNALDIDVLWKCIGYSGIFKSLGNYVNEIRGEEDMCEALRELMADDLKNAEKLGIERGLEQGLEQGVNNTNELYAWLFEQNRAADVQRATKDHAYLNKLMEEYKKRAQRHNC